MAGFVPAIHAFRRRRRKTWITGSSPVMTVGDCIKRDNAMAATGFAYSHLFTKDLPPAAPRWTGFPKYNFIGGHNDPEHVPAAALAVSGRGGAAPRRRRPRALQPAWPARFPWHPRIRRRQSRGAGHPLLARRSADHFRLGPGSRSGQSGTARARRHRDPRGIHLWRGADQAPALRGQGRRRAARR